MPRSKGASNNMDSFEFNKIAGALLGTVFVLFSISIVSDAIFATPSPATPGYLIEADEVEAAAGGGGASPAAPEEIGPLLAEADVDAGEAVFKRCTACHTVDQGGPNRVGPNLWDIVDRPIAAHEGFSYSAAMTEFSQDGSVVWDYEHLNGFILAPRSYIKGTAMTYSGLKKLDDRVNLIAYLRTLSDDPAPLPEPSAADEASSEPEDAETDADAAQEDADPADEAGSGAQAGEDADAVQQNADPAD